MKASSRSRLNFAVGLATLGVLVALGALAAFFVDRDRPFEARLRVLVTFEEVTGLKIGSAVTLQGLPVGRVEALRAGAGPDGRPRHEAVCAVVRDPASLRFMDSRSSWVLVTENLFGDRHVDVRFGGGGEPLDEGVIIAGATTPGVPEVLDALREAAADLRSWGRALGEAMGAEGDEGTGGASAVASRLKASMEGLEAIAGGLRPVVVGDGTPGSDLRSQVEAMAATLGDLRAIAGELRAAFAGQSSEEWAGTIAEFRAAVAGLARVSSELEAGLEGRGVEPVDLARTLSDIQASAADLREITGRVRATLDGPSRFWRRLRGREGEAPEGEGSSPH
ncbi:MAG: MCE family protein [Planctomycetes bacterium]|nr:MCE family protein [Planctomycetota bacterium]